MYLGPDENNIYKIPGYVVEWFIKNKNNITIENLKSVGFLKFVESPDDNLMKRIIEKDLKYTFFDINDITIPNIKKYPEKYIEMHKTKKFDKNFNLAMASFDLKERLELMDIVFYSYFIKDDKKKALELFEKVYKNSHMWKFEYSGFFKDTNKGIYLFLLSKRKINYDNFNVFDKNNIK